MPRKSNKTAKASKKPSIKTMQETHGKKEESKPTPTSLDQIWGDDGVWKYDTLDIQEYREKVATMTWSDLRGHATQHGLVPRGERPELEKKLIFLFEQHVGSYKKGGGSSDSRQQVSDAARRILEEGR